ncbi:unnamed protein product [Ectocarpus sp. 13 AM-2016]
MYSRKGCDQLFLGQLFKFRPTRLVYVSCDPATQVKCRQPCGTSLLSLPSWGEHKLSSVCRQCTVFGSCSWSGHVFFGYDSTCLFLMPLCCRVLPLHGRNNPIRPQQQHSSVKYRCDLKRADFGKPSSPELRPALLV